jgi:YD repeat-containing protein
VGTRDQGSWVFQDGEPDLFFFNFSGYSGKFFFRDDHTAIIMPQQDVKIIPYFPNPGTTSIQGFTIITPDGTQYFFGSTPGVTGTAPIELTNPYTDKNGFVSGTAISSWFLNKIKSFDNQDSITLSYVPESYGYYTISSTPLDPYPAPGVTELSLVKNIISGVRLSQINFPNGVVNFKSSKVRTDLSDNGQNILDNVNSSATSLDSITISNTSTTSPFCKRFAFYYGYFSDLITPEPSVFTTAGYNLQTDRSRLRLDSIREMSCDNLLQIPARRFTYFSEKVPRRISLGIDHWGFYNGIDTNKTLIPTFTTNDGTTISQVYGGNRNSYWPAMRGGSLQQMTYPTGGSTVFDFEPADSYPMSSTYQAMVLCLNTSTHMFGQDSTVPAPVLFRSDGNPISIATLNTTADIQAKFYMTDLSNNVVYATQFFGDNNYGGGGQTSTLPSVTLAAGVYKAYLSFALTPAASEGARVQLSQIDTLRQFYTVTIGGLRIKTITQKDSINSSIPIITSYTYPNGAYLYSFPTYVQHMRNDLITSLGYWDPVNGFTQGLGSITGCPLNGSYFLKSGGSIRPMATTQGYHVGYPIVNVNQTGNGHSSYNYYTSNSGYGTQAADPTVQTIATSLSACEATTPNYPAAPLPFDYKKGELYYEQHYNQAGQLLKDAYYYPEYDTSSLLPSPAFIVQARSNGGGNQILLGTLYNVSSPRRTKMHSIETSYTPGMGSVQQDTYTYYGSKFHNQVTRKVVTTSYGDSLITNTLYTPDLHSSNWDVSPSCESTYNTTCASCLTTKIHTDTATCHGNSLCLTNSFLAYRKCLSDARNTYVNSRFSNYTGVPNNYKIKHDSLRNVAGTELKPILDLQDEARIVPIEISDFRDGSFLKSNFTRYDYASYPAGIPYPNKTQLVSIAAPSSTFTNAVISGITVTKDSRYLDESTYSFLNGNPARVTGHDGMTTIYIWDYYNTNPIAKTISPVVDTTAFTSFEADGKGNWTIPSTVRDTINFLTGTKSYNLSSGSITKTGLATGKKYTISYWSKNGSYTIAGGTTTLSTGRSANGWTYYEIAITTTGNTITISGSGNIDELRLYPQGAQMSSYTYKPAIGITTMNDPNSEITYYEYDGLERLKNIKDYQGNIIKNYQYNYVDPNACGPNCLVVTMQTFAGTNTLSYPVGVFNVNGKLLGNVTDQAHYITAWMADTADSHTGTIVAGADSMHFKFTVNNGRTIPNGLTGCRYYQFDLPYINMDAVHWYNGSYVDFGDGTGMRLGTGPSDSNVVRAPNTFINTYSYIYGTTSPNVYWNHTYPDSSLKTLTFYHNDGVEGTDFDNGSNNGVGPALSLIHLKNFRGIIPQNTQGLGATSRQQASALTVASISNWNSITGILGWGLRTGDLINSCLNISYSQDFMANNKNLQSIVTNNRGFYQEGCQDTTFKISRLKSDWNTYFTNLTTLEFDDDNWNREDLTALIHLSVVGIGADNLHHSYNQTNNPLVPIPVNVIDNIINQISAGAGHYVSNGLLNIPSGGTNRSSLSDAGVNFLKSRGWTVIVNGSNL